MMVGFLVAPIDAGGCVFVESRNAQIITAQSFLEFRGIQYRTRSLHTASRHHLATKRYRIWDSLGTQGHAIPCENIGVI
jgi:hypothetical protein